MSKFRFNPAFTSIGAIVIAMSALALSVDQASARQAHVVRHAVHASAANGTSYDANGYSAELGAPEPNTTESRIEVPTSNGLRWETIETPAYTD